MAMDLRDDAGVADVVFNVNVVDGGGGGVDKLLLLQHERTHTRTETSFMLLQRRARTHDYCRMRVEGEESSGGFH